MADKALFSDNPLSRYELLLPAILLGYFFIQIALIPALPVTYNDGVNLQVSQLIGRGYEPYTQIFTLSSPFFVGFTGWLDRFNLPLTGIKLIFVLFALLLLVNIAIITRTLLGEKVALAAVFLLATATTFLAEAAATISAITPALSLATLALVLSLRYATTKQLVWAFLAGMVGGIAFFLSPSALSTGIIALIVVFFFRQIDPAKITTATIHWQSACRPAGAWLLGCVIALGVGLFLATPTIIFGHLLKDYGLLRENLPLVQAANFRLAGQFIAFNIWVFLFAAYTPARIYSTPDHPLWIILIWALLGFGWFMVQVAPRLVDLTILLPPVAIIAGWGTVDIARRLIVWSHRWPVGNSKRRLYLTCLGLVFLGVFFWGSWQRVSRFNLRNIDTQDDLIQLEQWPEIINFIQQHTTPEDCVIIDDPALAVAANRLPAPWLVQLSSERIGSGLLTQARIIALAQENNCKAVVFSKRAYTRPLSEFREWAESAYPNRQEFTRTDIYYQ